MSFEKFRVALEIGSFNIIIKIKVKNNNVFFFQLMIPMQIENLCVIKNAKHFFIFNHLNTKFFQSYNTMVNSNRIDGSKIHFHKKNCIDYLPHHNMKLLITKVLFSKTTYKNTKLNILCTNR